MCTTVSRAASRFSLNPTKKDRSCESASHDLILWLNKPGRLARLMLLETNRSEGRPVCRARGGHERVIEPHNQARFGFVRFGTAQKG